MKDEEDRAEMFLLCNIPPRCTTQEPLIRMFRALRSAAQSKNNNLITETGLIDAWKSFELPMGTSFGNMFDQEYDPLPRPSNVLFQKNHRVTFDEAFREIMENWDEILDSCGKIMNYQKFSSRDIQENTPEFGLNALIKFLTWGPSIMFTGPKDIMQKLGRFVMLRNPLLPLFIPEILVAKGRQVQFTKKSALTKSSDLSFTAPHDASFVKF